MGAPHGWSGAFRCSAPSWRAQRASVLTTRIRGHRCTSPTLAQRRIAQLYGIGEQELATTVSLQDSVATRIAVRDVLRQNNAPRSGKKKKKKKGKAAPATA